MYVYIVSPNTLKHLTKTRVSQGPRVRRRSPSNNFIRDFGRHIDKFSTEPITISE